MQKTFKDIIKNIRSRLISSLPGLQLSESTDFESWRIWYLKITIIINIFTIPAAAAVAFPVFLSDKNYLLIIFIITGWIILVSRLFSAANDYKVNAYIYFTVIYVLIVYGIIVLGPADIRSACLVFVSIIFALVFGNIGAVFSTVLNTTILIVLYIVIDPGNKAWADVYSGSLFEWFIFLVNLSIITLAASLSVGFLVNKFERSLKYERATSQRLSAETEKLKSANLRLENEVEQRRQAEKALSMSEEKYRLLIENIPSVTWITDEHGRTTFISPNVQSIFGYTPPEICESGSEIWFGRIHPDDSDHVMSSFQTMFTQKQDYDIQYRIRRKDERWIWIHDKGVQAFEKDGKRYAYGVFSDVTKQKQTEEALRKSEELYHALVETTNTGFVVIDSEGRVIDANQEYVRLSGHRDLDDIRGRSVIEWTADYEKEINSEAVRQCMKNGFLRNLEIDYTDSNGNAIPVEINATVIDKDGVPQILTLCRDITERRQAEIEKKKLEDKLAHSQKMEAIGTLAGGIAHDFNNILTPLLGYAELALNNAGIGTKMKKHLNEVLRAGNRARDLVMQILAFSRYSEHELKPIQVKNIVNEVLKLIRASLPSTIEIQQRISSESIIMADPVQIHQILMNLSTNAYHAMKKGGILEISLADIELEADFLKEHQELNPGPYIKITVSDTGHGMTPEIIERIFDPYFTTKAMGEGTGLGLAVVHGIVKSYKGAVTVQSEPGKGSAFNIFLPVIEAVQDLHEEPDTPLPTGEERILFVDDEPDISELGVPMLERLGYSVVAVTSSMEALELFKLQSGKFDLVITDMTMPGMTGEVLAGEIMRIRADIPIILCTGFSYLMNEKKAIQMGIRAFIMKPFVLRNIASSIREVLDKQSH